MIVTTDGQGRATLGPQDQIYRVTELEDGALLLEPVRVLTEVEHAVLGTPGLVEQLDASIQPSGSRRKATHRRCNA